MTHIYDNIFLRSEEDAIHNICINLRSDANTPTVEEIVEYVLQDPCERILYMDIKLNMVRRYDATNVFVDTGYKNVIGEPIFMSLVLKDDIFVGDFVGTLDHLGESILAIIRTKGSEQEVYNNIEFLKDNYGNYKQYVDEWDLKTEERKRENNLGDISCLFENIDISSFPETIPENTSDNGKSEEIAATLEIETSEKGEDSEHFNEDLSEVIEEYEKLPEIKTEKMYVYDYIPNKFYLVQCHTMLGTINFSLVNNHMDVFGNKIPLYSLFIVQYNQGTSLGQLNEDINLREYNLAVPERVVDEISEAINYIVHFIKAE
ncbi:MAG: hypothetical protein ACI4E1_03975 [Lachnospira sp.]